MSRFVIVDPFNGMHSEKSRREVEAYLHRLANQTGTRRYASLAFNHFTCGRYDQANAALAKLGIVFYRVGGQIEKRRGATGGYQVRKLPNRPGTSSEHRMGSFYEPGQTKPKPTESPRFIRTPQGMKPLNDAARKQYNPEPAVKIPSTIQPAPRKPWWRFW